MEDMKQHFLKIMTLCTLCLLGLTACIDHEPECEVCDEQPEGRGIWLSFDFDEEEQTRSNLQSSEVDYKEMKEVYLYVFNGTTAEAPCILAVPVGWKGEITQKHWISADLTSGAAYTFLAVGCDRPQGEDSTYGFPGIIKTGTTLGNCMAVVQDKMTPQDVAHEQFFVGTTTQQVTGDVVEVALTLRRKVAGILVYLRNIPVQVLYERKECEVKKIEVCLHKNQPDKLLLWKADKSTDSFGNGELKDSQVLFEVDLEKAGFKAQGEYFAKEGNDSVLDDSYLAGAYLLPMEKKQGFPTLSVNLRGDYTDGELNTEQNIVLKTYEVRYKAPESTTAVTDFDIKENTLYAIGKKLSNSSTSGDKPADLSGNLLELNVLKWERIPVENTFPTVTGPARIEAEFNDEVHIFNSWNNKLEITIKPAVNQNPEIKTPWELSVAYGGNEAYPEELPADWIHFENYDAEGKFVGWTNAVRGDGTKEVKVTVVINDYAVRRDLPAGNVYTEPYLEKVKKDIRKATLELRTEGVTEPYPLEIHQYNTLTIYSRGDKNKKGAAYRGIAWLNYGCSADKQTGEIMVSDSAKIQWGYFTTGNQYVSGDNPMDYTDGEVTSDHCYQRMKSNAWGSHAYHGSAIQRLTRRFIHLETTQENGVEKVIDKNPADPENQREKNWYLPAYYEMWGVSETFGNQYEALGRAKNEAYWTSSGDNGWYKDAYIAKIGVPQEDMQRDKDNTYHAMYMVHFDEQK